MKYVSLKLCFQSLIKLNVFQIAFAECSYISKLTITVVLDFLSKTFKPSKATVWQENFQNY